MNARRRAAAGTSLTGATPDHWWVVRVQRTVEANDGRTVRHAGWWAGPAGPSEFAVGALDRADTWPSRRAAEAALRSVFADGPAVSGVTRAAARGFVPVRVGSARQASTPAASARTA